MRRAVLAAVVGLLWVAAAVRADEPSAEGDAAPRPVLSADDRWARPVLWSIGGLFAAAAVVGPVVWLRARDTVPPAATHEEDPAADRR